MAVAGNKSVQLRVRCAGQYGGPELPRLDVTHGEVVRLKGLPDRSIVHSSNSAVLIPKDNGEFMAGQPGLADIVVAGVNCFQAPETTDAAGCDVLVVDVTAK